MTELTTNLRESAYRIRRFALRMGEVQGQGYIGQALGWADVLAVAYHHAPQSISQSKFEPLAALAVANALLPTDDTNAFGVALVSGLKVDSTFLSRVNAPFDWAEAAQRVAKTVCTAKL